MSNTKGAYRVGINFNPSGDDMVGQIKRAAADLIDLIETIPYPQYANIPYPQYANDEEIDGQHCGEIARLKELAQTDIETAAMYAVKAATKPAAR